jgi:nitroreductase
MRKSALLLTLVVCIAVQAQDLKPIQLPTAQTDGGRPLMQVLKERKTQREFSPEKLPMQVLANLLWAAFGINRPDGGRTAPSAMNWQEIDIYVALGDGLFLYNAKANRLEPMLAQDVRAATGTQAFVAAAPLNLVYVADLSKTGQSGSEAEFFTAADVGFISENVYLFCTSERLATVVRGSVDRDALAKIMKLGPNQKVLLAQTVGYSKKYGTARAQELSADVESASLMCLALRGAWRKSFGRTVVAVPAERPHVYDLPMVTEHRLGDIIANSVTHGVGAVLALAGAVALVLTAVGGTALQVASCSVFGSTLVLVYVCSTLYHSLVRESLTRWVAMWRPMQIYLYDWWPLLQLRRVFAKLSHMPVELVQKGKVE